MSDNEDVEVKGAVGGTKPKSAKQSTFVKKLIKDYNLKEPTVAKLMDNDFDTLEAISTLSLEDIDALNLSMGQRNILRKCVATIKGAPIGVHGPIDVSGDRPPTRRSIAPSDAQNLLESFIKHGDGNDSTTAISNPENQVSGESCSLHLPVTEKPKVNVARPHTFIDSKKTFMDVNLSEFMYGALLIMENMVAMSDPSVPNYLRHISFLALKSSQGFGTEGILAYDNALRNQVERSGRWPKDSDSHLANCHLVKINRQRFQKEKSEKRPNPLQNKCLRYNNGDPCMVEKCKYQHKCLLCSGNHAVTACNNQSRQNPPESSGRR